MICPSQPNSQLRFALRRASRRLLTHMLALLGIAGIGTVANDSPQEGRRIYHGLASAGQSCASCHGLSGEGGTEGGTAIPPIQTLFGEAQRYREPAELCRTLISGQAADGRRLARSMPRYALDPEQCRSLWQYLALRGSSLPPGIDARRIVVRVLPAPTTPSQIRWRDILANQFSEINRSGGLYGRQIVIEEGPGPAAFLLSLAPPGALNNETAIQIALRVEDGDPATRSVEANVDDEAAALLNRVRSLGLHRIRWIDELGKGPSPGDVELMADAEDLEVVGDDACRDAEQLAVVIVSLREALAPDCAAVSQLYVGLRTVPVAALPKILAGRPGGTTVAMFTALPLDAAFAAAPATIAGIIIETSRLMTANPSELRMLAAFDRSWRQMAEDDRTLFAGVGIQHVVWPAMTASGNPVWIGRPN